MAGGRPLKFESLEELDNKIEEYFAITVPEDITITGLALHLDTSRETLMNYEERIEYFDTIKKAKERVHNEYEKDLRKKGRSGDIFALKNFGWTDKSEQDIKQTVEQTNVTIDISQDDERVSEIVSDMEKKLRGTYEVRQPIDTPLVETEQDQKREGSTD